MRLFSYSFINHCIHKIACVVTLCILSSCVTYISGYRIQSVQKELDSISPGISKKQDIIKKLGTPTLLAKMNNPNREILIYGTEKYSAFLFIRRYVRERKMILYYIDENGILNEIKNIEKSGNSVSSMKTVDIRFSKPNKNWTLPYYLIV